MKNKKWIILNGIVVGIIAVMLVKLGNPANMGFCIACFLRDISGALGLHRADTVQYIRPEIIGLVLGSFIMALGKKEYKARGGSSPFIRFILGFIVIIGALMFLGCPLRMVLRLAGGDLNALVGLVGFVAGILAGIFFLNKGFTLKRTYTLNKSEGYMLPAANIGLFLLLAAGGSAGIILSSKSGPGSQHAPIYAAIIAGLIVGAFAQRTRLCMVGGIRDLVLFKDWYLISGFIAIFAAALLGNALLGNLKIGFTGQPIAHNSGLWNFLGMALAGLGSVMLGGCPLRQLILAGEGNIDSVMTILGMVVGAAFAHNFKLAASAKGPTPYGKVAVIIGFIVLFGIAYLNIEKSSDIKMKEGVKLEASRN